jgi:hypothetical protein
MMVLLGMVLSGAARVELQFLLRLVRQVAYTSAGELLAKKGSSLIMNHRHANKATPMLLTVNESSSIASPLINYQLSAEGASEAFPRP